MTSSIVIAVAVLLLAWAIVAFNGLVRAKNQVRAAWADVDVQLTRRHDLVPQLVTVVQAYATHEKTTLAAVTELRERAMRAQSPGERSPVEQQLGDAVKQLIVVAEAYPELRAGDNFLQLSRDLVDVEDHLQYARRYYNGAVRELNDRIGRFPDLVVAKTFAFAPAEFFAVPDAASAQAPRVEVSR